MTMPRDLDDYSVEELEGELKRRERARKRGDCDYCGRHHSTVPCKFPDRHAAGDPAFAITTRIVQP